MDNNRRKFLRRLAIGSGVLATGLPALAKVTGTTDEEISNSSAMENKGQRFNMCGYAAPKIETVRIGVIGLGQRGSEAVERLSYIDGVEIVALCDKYPDRVAASQKTLEKMQRPKAKEYSGEQGWKALCESNDIDLVYTPTPWHLHTPIA
ncbi:MAG: twin-arginine translocation signal domain-containing protein, partial [Chitinophagaceae bacterium]|nr:twin-arginine translocation signal domain-containing protein [Chitinophagaceae bacterium]